LEVAGLTAVPNLRVHAAMQFGGGVGAGAGGVAAAVAVVLDLLDQLSSVEMRWKRWCLIVMV